MIDVLLLGAGKIGAAIASMLAESGGYTVTVVDRERALLDLVPTEGIREGRLTQETYAKKIYGGAQWSAIQITTAAGVCAMVDLVFENKLPQRGFVSQEQARLSDFLANRFGRHYAVDAADVALDPAG